MKKKERINQLSELWEEACQRVDEYRTDLYDWQTKYYRLWIVTAVAVFVSLFFIIREIIKHL